MDAWRCDRVREPEGFLTKMKRPAEFTEGDFLKLVESVPCQLCGWKFTKGLRRDRRPILNEIPECSIQEA